MKIKSTGYVDESKGGYAVSGRANGGSDVAARRMRNTWLREVLLAVGVLTVVLLAMHTRKKAPDQSLTNGRFSAAQIIDRAQSLCSVIGTQKAGVRWAATPHTVYEHGSSRMPCWIVGCLSDSGIEVVTSRWDSNTGDLLQISVPAARPLYFTDKPLTTAELKASGQYWMRVLTHGDARQWKLVKGPLKRYDGWWCYWQSSDRRAAILIDGSHGGLRYAFFKPLSHSLPQPSDYDLTLRIDRASRLTA